MRYKIPIDIIELESNNYHLIVRSNFADGSKGNWVVDTGASKSVFDKNLAELCLMSDNETEELHSAGISDKPMTTELAFMKPFSFGKFETTEMKVALLDMTHINELYAKVSDIQVCGLLGSDFLMKYKGVIDYRRKRMLLYK